MSTKIDLYTKVTNTIIDALKEAEQKEWEMPWHRVNELPQNAITHKKYRGVNVFLLWAYQLQSEYKSNEWATFKQWREKGATVKKGEKGAYIVFWKAIEAKDEDDDGYMIAKWSVVFNADQVDGYETEAKNFNSGIDSIHHVENLISCTGAEIKESGSRAFYTPLQDFINMPQKGLFKDTENATATENYYATLLHELTHWTGSKKRLDRFKNGADKKEYAFEELIAELGAAMLCAELGINSNGREDHACYIAHWLEALESDTKFIFKASSKAQKAVDFILKFQHEKAIAV
jgi:antirestriction protein ArdC